MPENRIQLCISNIKLARKFVLDFDVKKSFYRLTIKDVKMIRKPKLFDVDAI